MKTIISALSLIVLGVLSSFTIAYTLDKHWIWFAQESIGQAVAFKAWWGISMMVMLLVRVSTLNLTREKTEDGEELRNNIGQALGVITGALITCGLSWTIGQIFGWI